MAIDALYELSRRYLETKYKSYHRSFIKERYFKHRLPILIGQRGVGKTTAIIQYLLDSAKNDLLSREILYVPTDHFMLGGMTLYEIAEQFTLSSGKMIVFDEIHKYTEWSKELKSIYDTFPDLKIIASGSSALEIYKGSHDLTRRAAVFTVRGLSFREYLEMNLNLNFSGFDLNELLLNHEKISQEILKKIKSRNKNIITEFNRYLKIGYYPYFSELNDETIYYMTLEQNFHMAIESDLSAIYPRLTGNSVKKIRQLLSFIAENVPFTVNFRKIKDIVGVSDERTLKDYLKYLEDAGLIRLVMKSSNKLRKLELPEKIYLDNPNELYAIAKSGLEKGTLRELFFLTMLSDGYNVTIPSDGDFLVDHQYVFEVGGKNKDFSQIREKENAYLVCDDIERGIGNKLPLWLLGFLY